MQTTHQLPSGFIKSLNDLARAREKAARQKYLLDIGESLIMHLCAFVIGEYKQHGQPSIDLEKSFLRNNKNLSLGIYIGWLREASKYLNTIKAPSILQNLLHGNNDFPPLKSFMAQFEAVRDEINQQGSTPLVDIVSKLQQPQGKTNLLTFFDAFVNLRNRVAHPHKEVKGKMITWPFSEDYFDAVNPGLEKALNTCFDYLNDVWQYRFFIYAKNGEHANLISEDDQQQSGISPDTNLEDGTRVLMNEQQRLLLADWKLLLKASDAAIQSIREEEEKARKMQSVDELKQAIIAALDDQQISLEEMRFFESLGRTKLSLAGPEIKDIILQTAKSLGIEDPFPETDKRYIQLVDEALLNKTYNEFVLKLAGQQYGVNPDDFEKLLSERAEVLNISLDDVRKNAVVQFKKEDLVTFTALQTARTWIMSMGVLNQGTGDSNYKITGNTHTFGTKEYWHRTAFESVELFIQSRLKALHVEGGMEWTTNQNNWQIGTMTSYCWCTVFPKDQPTRAILALHMSLYSDGSAAIGFLPDWKDYDRVENYGLLQSVTRKGLYKYIQTYQSDFEKFPDLLLWHQQEELAYAPLIEVYHKHPWFFDFDYSFEQIQFRISAKNAAENPGILLESFDIVYNLFNALIPELIKDYETYLTYPNPLDNYLQHHATFLDRIGDLIHTYRRPSSDRKELLLKGDAKLGKQYTQLVAKEKSNHVRLMISVSSDIPSQKLWYEIKVLTAGHTSNTHHQAIDKILQQLSQETFGAGQTYYRKGVLWVRFPIDTSADFPENDLYVATDLFLKRYTYELTKAGIQSLDLTPRHTIFEDYKNHIDDTLNEMIPRLTPLFSNKVQQYDRDISKRFMYWDYVSSNKTHGSHWIAWGIKAEHDILEAGLTLYLGDIQKGEGLYRQLTEFASQHPEWTALEEIKVSEEEENAVHSSSYRLSLFKSVKDEVEITEQMKSIEEQILSLKSVFGKAFGFA